jgi:hypothetical protein
MIREKLIDQGTGDDRKFRWRFIMERTGRDGPCPYK